MSSDNQRSARVSSVPASEWTNKHQNVTQAFDRLYSVMNPPSPVTDFFGDLRLTVGALQGLIADAIRDDHQPLRFEAGGRRSQNHIAQFQRR